MRHAQITLWFKMNKQKLETCIIHGEFKCNQASNHLSDNTKPRPLELQFPLLATGGQEV